jgi:hypothetical protein
MNVNGDKVQMEFGDATKWNAYGFWNNLKSNGYLFARPYMRVRAEEATYVLHLYVRTFICAFCVLTYLTNYISETITH